jgi:hypothetical protein
MLLGVVAPSEACVGVRPAHLRGDCSHERLTAVPVHTHEFRHA